MEVTLLEMLFTSLISRDLLFKGENWLFKIDINMSKACCVELQTQKSQVISLWKKKKENVSSVSVALKV